MIEKTWTEIANLNKSAHPATIMASCAFSALISGHTVMAQEFPNFIVIFTDDQGYGDLSSYGSQRVQTPNIDALGSEGMLYKDFHTVASVCTPSRAGLMTGCYAKRTGMGRLFHPDRITVSGATSRAQPDGLNANEITIPEVCEARDYVTGCIGKWHLGHEANEFLPTGQGFDYFYGLLYSVNQGNWCDDKFLNDRMDLFIYENASPVDTIKSADDRNLLTSRYTDKTLDFIETHADTNFFLYLAHSMPHKPTGTSWEVNGSAIKDTYDIVIEEIDSSVGLIIDKLKELGIDRKTLVIFSSDNGPDKDKQHGSPEPLRGWKDTPYEGGFRVPCLMRWPQVISPGRVCDEFISTMDILPTIASIIGVKLPDDREYDGYDILPILRNEPGARSRYDAFAYFGEENGSKLSAIRMGGWKYFPDSNELYNLSSDISESQNVAVQNDSLVSVMRSMALSMSASIRKRSPPAPVLELIDPMGNLIAPQCDMKFAVPEIRIKGRTIAIDNVGATEPTVLKAYGVNGRIAYSAQLGVAQSIKIDARDWPAGVYILKLTDYANNPAGGVRQVILY